MSFAERNQTAASRRAAKKAEQKPAPEQAAVKTPEEEEEEYQAELKKDHDEEQARIKSEQIAAMNGAGAAIKATGEKQEEVKQEEVKQEEVKQEEVKQEEVKQEEVKQVELPTSHPDMCSPDLFGSYDPASKDCFKDCAEFSPECAAQCKALMESRKVAGKAPKASKASKTSSGASNKGLKGNYRTKGMKLSQICRDGSFGRALAVKISSEEGMTEADYIEIAKVHGTAGNRLKAAIKYFSDEGYTVTLVGSAYKDLTTY